MWPQIYQRGKCVTQSSHPDASASVVTTIERSLHFRPGNRGIQRIAKQAAAPAAQAPAPGRSASAFQNGPGGGCVPLCVSAKCECLHASCVPYFLYFNLFSERFAHLNLLKKELRFWTLEIGAMFYGAKITRLGVISHGAELCDPI